MESIRSHDLREIKILSEKLDISIEISKSVTSTTLIQTDGKIFQCYKFSNISILTTWQPKFCSYNNGLLLILV